MSTAFRADDRWTSWGRVVRARHDIARPRFADQLPRALAEAATSGRPALAVGLGRSYGDSNLNPDGALIDVSGLDRIMAFDPVTGIMRAEAGISLSEILRVTVPRGWFLATTPGTRFVTLGGAIANDVHGKNHQEKGSFGCCVRLIGLLRSDGSTHTLQLDDDLFGATLGGLGLTGVIAWADVQLTRISSAFIAQEITPFGRLADYFAIAADSAGRFEHAAAWIDCTAKGDNLGRGVFTRGNWCNDGDLAPHSARMINVPVDGVAAAFHALPLMNAGYGALQLTKQGHSRAHYSSHIFPLDAIGSWNRLYGRGGFYQYQCVVPEPGAQEAIADLLRAIAAEGVGSILVVLKTLGDKRSPGLISFPMPGVTLAMDFVNRGQRTLDLFARLDDIVRAVQGRLYAAKDGRIPAAMFQAGYPEWRRFAAFVDPALSSSFWRRVSA